jgi:hypothetical protein
MRTTADSIAFGCCSDLVPAAAVGAGRRRRWGVRAEQETTQANATDATAIMPVEIGKRFGIVVYQGIEIERLGIRQVRAGNRHGLFRPVADIRLPKVLL